jgi:hypothetical protein
MRPLWLLLLAASTAAGQTVYNVTPGSKGNELTLVVANGAQSPVSVEVVPGRIPGAVTMTPGKREIDNLAPSKETEVTFTFSVDRSAKVNTQDTLQVQVNDKGGKVWTKKIVLAYLPPDVYALEQNYPNPFNPKTAVSYQLSAPSKTKITIYDVLGREVAVLVDEVKEAGYYETVFDASRHASGMYIYRLDASALDGKTQYHQVKRMMLLK